MRKLCFLLAAVFFVVFIAHWSPWNLLVEGGKPLPELLLGNERLPAGTHYFELERDFWTAFFCGLFLAFLGEGLLRRSPRGSSYSAADEAF